MAEKNAVGQRSYRVATRRQSLRRPNMISMRLRRLYRRLSYLTGLDRDFRPGMQGLMPFCDIVRLKLSAEERALNWVDEQVR